MTTTSNEAPSPETEVAAPLRKRRRKHVPRLIPLDKAILMVAQDATSCFEPDVARERLGQAWMDARLKATEIRASPSVQRTSGVMQEMAEAARGGASIVDEPCDPWPSSDPTGPYDECEAAMRDRWLRTMVNAANDRNARMMGMYLGLDDRPMSAREISELGTITRSAVSATIEVMVTRLSRAWARVQREAAFLLDGAAPPDPRDVESGDPPAAEPDAPDSQRHRDAPKEDTCAPSELIRRRGRRRSVDSTDGALRIGGLVIRRHGEDAYRIEGSPRTLDATGVAMAIRNVMSDNVFIRRRYNVEAYDTYIADEMRAILRNGPVWPTKAVLRIALPLTRPDDQA